MSSHCGQIIAALEAKVASALSGFKQARYYYIEEENDAVTTKKCFRVYQGSGSKAEGGTLNRVSKTQQFIISLEAEYIDKNNSDKSVRDAIEVLNEAHEQLQILGMGSRFNIPKITVVENFEFSNPEIDEINKTVSIDTTFTITYRMG